VNELWRGECFFSGSAAAGQQLAACLEEAAMETLAERAAPTCGEDGRLERGPVEVF